MAMFNSKIKSISTGLWLNHCVAIRKPDISEANQEKAPIYFRI